MHTYGPHLFHTDNKDVIDYLSKFTEWHPYVHEVLALVDEQIIPIPFNFNTIDAVYDRADAEQLKQKLLQKYGKDQKIPILELMKEDDPELQKLAQFVYDKIFVNYTAKQWGKKPEEIDGAVTARVPVLTSYDNRYFQDNYQGVPKAGYTKMFEKMLESPNITIELGSDALERLEIRESVLYFDDQECHTKVIFTGMIDELFQDKLGALPYRSIELQFETLDQEFYQDHAVINFPNVEKMTRITEFKHIHPATTSKTTILKEFPQPYIRHKNTPYYPMFTDENQVKYERYAQEAAKVPNLLLVGRLAEYKYYDMDDIVEKALEVFEGIISL